MSVIKRITTTLRANVEHLVDQMENQSAVVEAAIREMKQANARARARLGRVRREREGLEQRLDELKQSAQKWQQRALQSAAEDEATALSCLQRHNQCAQQARDLEADLQEQHRQEQKLQQQLERTDQRVRQLSQRRQLMRSRESNLQAEQIIGQWQEPGPIDVEAVFERWEGRLIESEPLADALAETVDVLAERFEQEEQQTALRDQLQAMMQRESSHE